MLQNSLSPVRPSSPYHRVGVLLASIHGGVSTGPVPPVDFVVLSVKIEREEDCRSSCRDVDSGETPENPHHPATLPNLGMWMKSPNSTARWTTRPHPLTLSPSPVENRLPYPPDIPDFPSVRTPCCPHYAHLIHTGRKVIHNSTAILGKRCTYTQCRPIPPRSLGKTGGRCG